MAAPLKPNTYRVEVSGWDASENFFVEKTTLTWAADSPKQLTLRSSLREGCVLFVRLIQSPAMSTAAPVAYQAVQVEPPTQAHPDSLTRVSLVRLRPRMNERPADLFDSSGSQAA